MCVTESPVQQKYTYIQPSLTLSKPEKRQLQNKFSEWGDYFLEVDDQELWLASTASHDGSSVLAELSDLDKIWTGAIQYDCGDGTFYVEEYLQLAWARSLHQPNNHSMATEYIKPNHFARPSIRFCCRITSVATLVLLLCFVWLHDWVKCYVDLKYNSSWGMQKVDLIHGQGFARKSP